MSAVFYSVHLFRPKFFKHLGLLGSQVGDVLATMALVSFISMTFWGTVSDRLGRHRFMLALSAAGIAGSFMLYLVTFNSSSGYFAWVLFVGALYGFFQSGLQPLTDYQALKMLSQYNIGRNPKDLYGKQRLWGTVSYGATSYIVSRLLKNYGPNSLFYCLPIASIAFILVLYVFAVPDRKRVSEPHHLQAAGNSSKSLMITKEKQQADEKQEQQQQLSATKSEKTEKSEKTDKIEIPVAPVIGTSNSPQSSTFMTATVASGTPTATTEIIKERSTREEFTILFSNPHYLFLLLVVFLTGSARAIMTNFLALFLEEDMKLKTDEIAIAANCGIALEIVIFFFGPFFIRTIGVYWMLIASQIATVVRSWAYVFIPVDPSSLWYVFTTELLKGVAFGFTQSAGVKLASDVSPSGLEATAQAVYTSVYSQLPGVITAFVGGRVYKHFGASVLFLSTAIMSSAALALFVIKYVLDGSIRIKLCCR